MLYVGRGGRTLKWKRTMMAGPEWYVDFIVTFNSLFVDMYLISHKTSVHPCFFKNLVLMSQ